jgi:N-acetyl-gamma-glutamylphosphate reductase
MSLLTVQVMIDRNGKGGAAQVVHAFNVMNGFEESLGIA